VHENFVPVRGANECVSFADGLIQLSTHSKVNCVAQCTYSPQFDKQLTSFTFVTKWETGWPQLRGKIIYGIFKVRSSIFSKPIPAIFYHVMLKYLMFVASY